MVVVPAASLQLHNWKRVETDRDMTKFIHTRQRTQEDIRKQEGEYFLLVTKIFLVFDHLNKLQADTCILQEMHISKSYLHKLMTPQ